MGYEMKRGVEALHTNSRAQVLRPWLDCSYEHPYIIHSFSSAPTGHMSSQELRVWAYVISTKIINRVQVATKYENNFHILEGALCRWVQPPNDATYSCSITPKKVKEVHVGIEVWVAPVTLCTQPRDYHIELSSWWFEPSDPEKLSRTRWGKLTSELLRVNLPSLDYSYLRSATYTCCPRIRSQSG